ncbi:hypothetical protein ABDK00_001860 [Niabella insulamsoli]|uniref:hypothetical protein n=1 Tax=Niabella insulamsoli TaxID=3144874 RepID=UPI0031FC5D85
MKILFSIPKKLLSLLEISLRIIMLLQRWCFLGSAIFLLIGSSTQHQKQTGNISFGGSPIKDIFAYRMGDHYALYINIAFKTHILDSLVKTLGVPDNVLEEDLAIKDYDFLFGSKIDLKKFGSGPVITETMGMLLLS